MSAIEIIVVTAVTVLLLGPTTHRMLVGRVCPSCRNGRLRCTGQTLFIPEGSMPTWKCKQCGTSYCQPQLDDLERGSLRMTTSWYVSVGAAFVTFCVTVLSFVVLTYLGVGLGGTNFEDAVYLGSVWGVVGACPIGLLVRSFQSPKLAWFLLCLGAWWVVSTIFYIRFIGQSQGAELA